MNNKYDGVTKTKMKTFNYENESYYINLVNKKLKNNNYYEIAVTDESSNTKTEWLILLEKWLKSIENKSLEYVISLDNNLSSVALTQSIQNQIDEAYQLGYTKVSFPMNSTIEVIDICDGLRPNNNYKPTLLFLRSNTIYDLNGSTIKIKSNNYIGYNILLLELLDRTILKNGNIIGDKDTHLYDNTSTHEFGCGILFYGSKKSKLQNLNISNMTGDGCYMSGIISYYSKNIQQSDMIEGTIDNNTGEDTNGIGYRLTKFIELNSLLNSDDINKGLSLNNKLILFPGNPWGYGSAGQFSKKEVTVLFYNESYTFISAIDSLIIQPINIPQGAYYIKYYFPNTDMSSMTDQLMMLRIGELSEECFVDGCDIGYCRRQGCTVAKSINSGIINSIIHDIKGTLPQSCIDIEDGEHATQSIIVENNIFKDSPVGVVCYDGSYHTINKNYFNKLKYPLSINASAGVSINNCTIIGGDIVSLSAHTTIPSYLPQNLIINNINIINPNRVVIDGSTYFSGGVIKNANYIGISNGAYVENSTFSQKYSAALKYDIDNSQIYNCKFLCNDNVYLINIKNSNLNTVELTKGSVLLAGNTIIKNSIINQFTFLSSYPSDSKLVFDNCTLGIISNPWKAASAPIAPIDIEFENCIITQQTESVYGIIPLYTNTNISFNSCQITDLLNNKLHHCPGLKGTVKYKDCTIRGKKNSILCNYSVDTGKIYLIDSKIINIIRPDMTNINIIDEDCEWRNE